MKSSGYLYIYGEKLHSTHEKMSKENLRKIFGTGITIGEFRTYTRRRYKSHKEVGQQGKKRKKTKEYYEKASSPKHHRKGRTVWL